MLNNVHNAIKSHYIARMRSSSIQAYKQLFASLKKPHLYTAPWWLDATCGDEGWDAVIHFDNERAVAGLAYHKTTLSGLSAIITPPLTQWVSLLSADKTAHPLLSQLISQLPPSSIFDLTLKAITDVHLQDDRLPIDLKYSYVLPYAADENLVKSGYSEGLRRNLRQAEKNYTVEASEDISKFVALCQSSYQLQKIKSPKWLEAVLPRVFENLKSNQVGQLTLAFYKGEAIAGVLTAWDDHSTYYLAGGRAVGEEAASAHALLLDHALLKAHQRKTDFDFEGSMHPGIANFFQSFGAIPLAYWHIKRYRGLGKIWSALH